jgi:hypothetical protein
MRQPRTSGRSLLRAALVGFSSLVTVVGALAVSTPAQAASGSANPYAPSYQHPYRHGAVPTREALTKINEYDAQHVAPLASAANLRYGGGVDGIGVTTGKPKVYLVFWGSSWGTSSTDANGNLTFTGDSFAGAPKLQQMFKGLGTGGELWSGVMTQFCEGVAAGSQTCPASAAHVGYPTGGAFAGVWYDNTTVATTTNGHQIAVEAVAAASHFGNTTAASNRSAQYVILSPHNFHPDGWSASAGWCAWHDWNGDTTLTGGAASSSVGDIAFTNMPYTMDLGTSCGQNFVNSGTAGNLDGYTMVEGHEYSETITDQNPAGGWTDTSGAENADKCAWVSPGSQGGAANVAMGNGSYTEQGTWSNDTNGGAGQCEISHAIVGGGTSGVTVTNPGNQTSTVGTAVSRAMSASGGTAPYTWSATGLPAGLSINASTGAISGTPTTAGTSSVTVTAHDSAAATGSTSFSWTVNPVGTGCTSSGQKLANPGFESGAVSWTATAGVITNSTSEAAHSGTWKAWLDGYGSSHTDSASQAVTLPSGCTTYTLSLWLHIDSAETTTTTAYDTLKVQIIDGATTSTLATYSNLNKATGYSQKSFNLSAYAGHSITVKFLGVEDSSLQTSFVVDDTALTVA